MISNAYSWLKRIEQDIESLSRPDDAPDGFPRGLPQYTQCCSETSQFELIGGELLHGGQTGARSLFGSSGEPISCDAQGADGCVTRRGKLFYETLFANASLDSQPAQQKDDTVSLSDATHVPVSLSPRQVPQSPVVLKGSGGFRKAATQACCMPPAFGQYRGHIAVRAIALSPQ